MLVNLQCLVPRCSPAHRVRRSRASSSIRPAINPVYNAVVMIPNGGTTSRRRVQPIAAGRVERPACGGAPLPVGHVVRVQRHRHGTFTLTGGARRERRSCIVIQTGRWRRMITVNTSSLTCGSTR